MHEQVTNFVSCLILPFCADTFRKGKFYFITEVSEDYNLSRFVTVHGVYFMILETESSLSDECVPREISQATSSLAL